MADVEEITLSPVVPSVNIQLDISGELKTFKLRLSLLAVRSIEAEITAMEEGGLDNFLRTAIMIKHCLCPRDHGMDNEDILDAVSLESMTAISQKIKTLTTQKGASGNPTKGKRNRSRTKSGGNSKPPRASASGSDSASSGTRPQVN